MEFNVLDYTDEEIIVTAARYLGELTSIALPLSHISGETLSPPPDGASEHQRWLWVVQQLAHHPDADEFSRGQLMKFLVGLKGSRL